MEPSGYSSRATANRSNDTLYCIGTYIFLHMPSSSFYPVFISCVAIL